MILATFDLYGKQNTNNHGINVYYEVVFDWKKISYKSNISKNIKISDLIKVLNNSNYRACHNFTEYDWNKLAWLESHSERNIDTLLIDSLLNFNKPNHNLKKLQNNNPLEDAKSTFKVLEKNIITFYKLSNNIKNILYSLLLKYDEYNDFFIFYNKLTNNKLELLSNQEIIFEFNKILINKNLISENIDFNFDIFLNSQDWKLSFCYLVLFIEKNTINLPDFIYKNNKELVSILREYLNSFYEKFSNKFKKDTKVFLKDFYDFDWFRWETQINWVKSTLENKDILTILSTGGWKSLIYQLPAIIIWEKLGHLSLVITPLKALIKDQIDWLNKKGFNEVKYFSGDQSSLEKEIIYNKIKSWETKILFLTPESLRNEKNLELFKNRYISRIIIDEAHTLILWGQEFRPDYFFIKTFLDDLQKVNLNKKINITLLTATATTDVELGLKNYFNDRILNIIRSKEILKENIKPNVINITNKENKLEILINSIKKINVENNPTIIFTGRRKTSEELTRHLNDEWIKTNFFHAWMFLNEKKKIQEDFISWKLNLIIATKAFWMWIDKENVRYIIHYDLPWNIEDYTQEIWRAWRDWKKSKNIIFYDKKDIEKRIKMLEFSWIKYYHIINFLKYVNLKNNENKIVLSPRQIAGKSYIKTNKKNWITDIKILLNFLEREKFDWINFLERKYDNTYILFNKVEEKEVKKNYKVIEEDNFLNKNEKELAKNIIYKIIEEKKALDLNELEKNFEELLWEDFDYKNISLNKITNKIKSLRILWKWEDNDESDIVIEAWNILKKEDFRENIFNIYKKRVKNIENFEEKNNKSNFYEKIKNYYLFKNNIKEKKWEVFVQNKISLEKPFDKISEIWKIVLENIFDDDKKYLNKQTVNLLNLLKILQEKYHKNLTISELKEVLYFLHSLDIISVKNGLLVFLTRYSLEFNKNIFDLKNNLENEKFKEEFKYQVRAKLQNHIEMKKNKLLSLQKIVEVLESKSVEEYTHLTKYYFNSSLKEFSEKYLKKKDTEYEEYLFKQKKAT